jgi:Fic family protein
MRMPVKPAPLGELECRFYDEWEHLRYTDGKFLLRTQQPLALGKYRHWDKVRRLTPPEGLTHEQWWFFLKWARQRERKSIALMDTRDVPFSYVLPDPAQKLLHDLSMSLGGKMRMDERVLNPQTRDQYYISSLFEEAITSSQLEGAATTRVVAEEMLRTGRRPRNKSEQMILNNYRAMQRLRGLKGAILTPDAVFELHRLVSEETLDRPDQAGRLRREDEDIAVVDTISGEILHQPPPAGQLPQRIQAMCDFANGKTPEFWIHPIVRAILLHFWLAYDHPFLDGNGRTARALFYWAMMREDYWLCEFLSISSVIIKGPFKYVRAFLYTETDDNDLAYFILYHLDVLQKAVQAFHDYVQRKSGEIRDLEDRLKGVAELNHRQRALVAHALRHPRQEYTFRSHRESHAVVYDTARIDLLDLERRGYLIRRKRGKQFVFVPADGLAGRLAH